MSIPKEPRQLMINLMYLVLTAMLALNISSEILNAFQTINTSIEKSNSTIVSNNATLYQSMDALTQMADQRARVLPYYEKAKLVKAESDRLVTYFDTLKQQIIRKSGGIDQQTGHIVKEGDIDVATRMFVEGTPESKKGGEELKTKITTYRDYILAQVGNADAKKSLADAIPVSIMDPRKTDENPSGDWAHGNFFHMPSIAAVTLLSKYQNDVRNAEAMVVQQLMSEADAGVIKFDAIQAIAVPKTSYALQGDKIEAQIMLAAYNKTINPSVAASSGRVTQIKEGVANWETTASGLGVQTVRGSLTVDFNGRKESRPWEFKYVVGSVGASMQLDKMNVFYVGLDNPVTVSAAGFALEDVRLQVTGGGATVKPNGLGKYLVRVTQAGTVTAELFAGKPGAAQQKVMSMPIRIKFVPSPEAQVAGKIGGTIASSVFKVQSGVAAVLKDFLFDGVKYDLVSFDFAYQQRLRDYQGPFTVNGAYFKNHPEVARYMGTAKPGDKVYIENIRARGPDGRTVQINSLIFTLN